MHTAQNPPATKGESIIQQACMLLPAAQAGLKQPAVRGNPRRPRTPEPHDSVKVGALIVLIPGQVHKAPPDGPRPLPPIVPVIVVAVVAVRGAPLLAAQRVDHARRPQPRFKRLVQSCGVLSRVGHAWRVCVREQDPRRAASQTRPFPPNPAANHPGPHSPPWGSRPCPPAAQSPPPCPR